jgi:2-oxoglutarate dehydrogenase E1 component
MFKLNRNHIKAISSKVNLKLKLPTNSLVKSFLSGTNSRYVEEMHKAWEKNPDSVHVSWRTYFDNLKNGITEQAYVIPPTLDPVSNLSFTTNASVGSNKAALNDQTKIAQLIRVYQKQGYLKANLDPLGLMDNAKDFPIFNNAKDLSYVTNGFTKEDLEKEFNLPENMLKTGLLGVKKNNKMKLKDLIQTLEKAYCGDIGVEFRHISSRDETNFIIDAMENRWVNYKLSEEEKIETYQRLALATKFESFLEVKFMTKRFGLEGLESMITGLHTYFETASNHGVLDITLGMAHRGRLNVLANIFGKPIITIFKEMMGKQKSSDGDEYSRTGDVKYHLGHSQTKQMKNGRQLTMEILNNPSHLECVNPVVQGKVRAKQHFNKDESRER